MNIVKEYIAYLRHNPEGYWFKRKLYGWGWTPATWQGWLILFVFVALIALNAYRIDSASHSASDTITAFVPQTAILVLVLIGICWKTGETPRWQWGIPNNNQK